MPPWFDAGRLRSADLDRRGARALHRAVALPGALRLLVLCSQLADAPLWVALLIALPLLDGHDGARCAWRVLALGGINLAIYWSLKRGTRRKRPFDQCSDIRACMRVPDPFSFPSGHTLHAVAFAVLLPAFYPALAPLLWPFALLVGVSRVVLGLHYPSDVLAGALLGAGTASLVLLSV
jgi:undecaprenyl-diphosphatase